MFALSVGIALPGGYFGLNYSNLVEHVETVAQVKAGAVNTLATANPGMWMYQLQRMEELLLRYPISLTGDRATVRDADGNSLLTVGVTPDTPVLVRSSPIYDSGRVVGQVEITHSYRGVVSGTLVAGLLGLLLGALVYATLLVLPLRALRRVTAALVRESAALSASASRYRAVAKTARDAIVTADGAGTIVGWNPAAERMFGYTEAEVIGQPLTLVMPHRYHAGHLDGMRRIQAGGERHAIGKSVELHGQTKAGREFPLELALSEWEVPEGRFFAGIIRDITERKRSELALARQKDLYEMLSQTNQAIVRITNRAELFPIVCRVAVEHGRFRFAWVGLIGDEDKRVKPVARYGEDAGYLDQMYISADESDATGRGPTGQALRAGQRAVSNDFLNDPATAPWHEAARRAGVRASAALPIRQGGAVVGAINFYAGEPGFFTEDVLATLGEMAVDVSYALDNFAHDAALKRVIEALHESEEELRAIFESVVDGILVVHGETRRLLIGNPAICRMLGYTLEEIGRLGVPDIHPEQDLPRVMEEFERQRRGESQIAVNIPVKRKDGSVFFADIKTAFIRLGGKEGLLGVFRDVTERKVMEEKLRDSIAFRELLLQAMPLPIFHKDASGRYTGCNRAFTEFIGKAENYIVGKTVYQLAPQSFAATYRDKDLELLSDPAGMQVYESRVMHADGTAHEVIFHKACTVDSAGRPTGIVGVITDITARKRVEDSLRASDARYRSLFENNEAVMLLVDPADGSIVEANPAACTYYGYEPAVLQGMTIYDINILTREQVQAEVDRAAMRGKYHLDFRHRLANGEVRDVEVFISPIEVGGRKLFFSIVQDVTERLEAKQQLVEAEARFRGLVEQSIAGIYIIQDGTFVYVNPRFAEIRGYRTVDEVIGRDPLPMVAEKDRGTAAENDRRLFAGEIPSVDFTFVALCKGGSSVEVGVHSALATYRGRPAIIGLMQDISEKKRAEEQINHYIAQLENVFMQSVAIATTLSEMRDPYTAGHERRVAEIAVAIGAELGFDARRQEGLRVAGYLHDLGKISIPAEILSKPGKLNPTEYLLIKGHAQAGYDILKNVEFPWPVAVVVLQHHERMDGNGYPQGLKGEAILLEARILAVADVVEAMSSHRPYRPGLGIERALAEIERGRGTAFDANVTDACLKLFREMGYTIPI